MRKLIDDFGIRALFGSLIIIGFIVTSIYAMVYKPDMLDAVKDMFVPIVMAVISFYFGQKSVK